MPASPRSRRLGDRTAWILAAAALLVFLPGIWWGLPHAAGPGLARGWDVDAVTGISTLAELHNLFVRAAPDWYVPYPPFHYLVVGAAYVPYLALLWLTGGISTPVPAYPYGLADPVEAIRDLSLIGRGVTLAMAVGTVVFAYAAARTVWDRRTGVATALVVLLAGPMVYRARTGNLDVPVLFWTALGVLVLAGVVTRGFSVRRAIWLGAAAALATATKDQAYAAWLGVIPPLFFMHFRGALPPPGERWPVARWRAPLALILTGLTVYTVAQGVLFEPERLVRHLEFVLDYREPRLDFAALGLERARTPRGLLLLLGDSLRLTGWAIGPVFLLAGLGGLVARWRSEPFLRLLAAMLIGTFLLFIVPIAHVQLRYTLLPALVLAFAAARLLVPALDDRGWRRAAALGAYALGIALLAVQAADLTYQMLHDARRDAGRFLAEALEPGDRVGYFGDAGQLPPLPAGVSVRPLVDSSPHQSEAERRAAPPPRFEAVDVVLVIPDYTSPPGVERSLFLPRETYEGLRDGSLGFTRLARFETRPPLGIRYPFVNPPVQVFARSPGGGSGPGLALRHVGDHVREVDLRARGLVAEALPDP